MNGCKISLSSLCKIQDPPSKIGSNAFEGQCKLPLRVTGLCISASSILEGETLEGTRDITLTQINCQVDRETRASLEGHSSSGHAA